MKVVRRSNGEDLNIVTRQHVRQVGGDEGTIEAGGLRDRARGRLATARHRHHAGTACMLSMNIMPRDLPAAEQRRVAHGLYAAGTDALFFWDTYAGVGRADFDTGWNALRRLGHRAEIAGWMAAGEPTLALPTVPLQSFGGFDTAYSNPG